MLHVLMLPDFDRVDRIGEFLGLRREPHLPASSAIGWARCLHTSRSSAVEAGFGIGVRASPLR